MPVIKIGLDLVVDLMMPTLQANDPKSDVLPVKIQYHLDDPNVTARPIKVTEKKPPKVKRSRSLSSESSRSSSSSSSRSRSRSGQREEDDEEKKEKEKKKFEV